MDEGRSSHTRFVSGVRLLQSPSEWTDDTEDGLSPPDRPGPGDLALRPFERPLLFEDFPPPTNARSRSLVETDPALLGAPPTVPHSEGLWIALVFADAVVLQIKTLTLFTVQNKTSPCQESNEKINTTCMWRYSQKPICSFTVRTESRVQQSA